MGDSISTPSITQLTVSECFACHLSAQTPKISRNAADICHSEVANKRAGPADLAWLCRKFGEPAIVNAAQACTSGLSI